MVGKNRLYISVNPLQADNSQKYQAWLVFFRKEQIRKSRLLQNLGSA